MVDPKQSDDLSTFVGSFHRPDPSSKGPPRLIFLSGPSLGRKVLLRDPVTIGRSGSATVAVDDQNISRLHVKFTPVGDADTVMVEDLKSKNGTFVNDERITRKKLVYGDKVLVGSSVLLFTHHNPLDEQLAHKSKMEMLGRLGAGIAHDFNNLLGVMIATEGFLDSLPRNHTLTDPEVSEARADMRAALRRAADLTGRLLGVARHGDQSFGEVNMTFLLQEVVDLVRRTNPKTIGIEHHLAPNLLVAGDRGQLHQLVLNLCVNAVDAMPEGGLLTVRASLATSGSEALFPAAQGDYVVVTVSDTGIGMDERTRKQAFDPFFTTKPRGEGTGLGLATVAETVKHHGGRLALESERQEGTTVRVYLPAMQPVQVVDTTAIGKAMREESAPAEDTQILLVDDDPAIRRSIGRLLKSMGYHVITAGDGEEALEVYAAERPDLVILDLDMPRLAGRPTFQALKQRDPAVRVLWMSGHWSDRYDEEFGAGEPGPLGFLQKPCEPDELRRAIEMALRTTMPKSGGNITAGASHAKPDD